MHFMFIFHQSFWLIHSDQALITRYLMDVPTGILYTVAKLKFVMLIDGSIRLLNQSIGSQKLSIDWLVLLQASRLKQSLEP